MARVRKIYTDVDDDQRNYFLVDTNFLVNRFIPPSAAPVAKNQRTRIEMCLDWWKEIDDQVKRKIARVYIPDVCIAEAFKVLAKKRYREKWLNHNQFAKAKRDLSSFVRLGASTLRAVKRFIPVHDISTNRDIIVSVDRFFELFDKHKKDVQIADLILLATAKYLMDFYDIARHQLHIVTLDTDLRTGIAKVQDLPNAYDPTLVGHRAELVFEKSTYTLYIRPAPPRLPFPKQ